MNYSCSILLQESFRSVRQRCRSAGDSSFPAGLWCYPQPNRRHDHHPPKLRLPAPVLPAAVRAGGGGGEPVGPAVLLAPRTCHLRRRHPLPNHLFRLGPLRPRGRRLLLVNPLISNLFFLLFFSE